MYSVLKLYRQSNINTTRAFSTINGPQGFERVRIGNDYVLRVDNPYTGELAAEVAQTDANEVNRRIASSNDTFKSWRKTSIDQRLALVKQFTAEFEKHKQRIAMDITNQMGKPLKQALGEVSTAIARAVALSDLAPAALSEQSVKGSYPTQGSIKKITLEPIGPVLCLSPWNYPLLCAVNTVVAAVLSGCPVLLKHSDRTPLCAEHFVRAFADAGAPQGLVQSIHGDHELVHEILVHPGIAHITFTGSVAGGAAVYKRAASRFIDVGLELGGKDAAYVAEDADLIKSVDGVVDGAFYNAGQSCCSVERVYVHESKYEEFIRRSVAMTKDYVLGDPMSDKTTMGPIAQKNHSTFLQSQVDDARMKGGVVVHGGRSVSDGNNKGRFFLPTIIRDASHHMSVMVKENFGPILSVCPVKNDEEAVKMINDSPYGLTASVWTSSLERAHQLTAELDVGTVYMNRCDFLDPYLSWSGRKDSGKGIGLSHLSFAAFHRTKSYNFRV